MFYFFIIFVIFNFVLIIDNQFIYEFLLQFINLGYFFVKKLLLGVNRNEVLYFLFYVIYVEMEWLNNILLQFSYMKILLLVFFSNGFEKLEIKKDKFVIDVILD